MSRIELTLPWPNSCPCGPGLSLLSTTNTQKKGKSSLKVPLTLLVPLCFAAPNIIRGLDEDTRKWKPHRVIIQISGTALVEQFLFWKLY